MILPSKFHSGFLSCLLFLLCSALPAVRCDCYCEPLFNNSTLLPGV